MGAPRTVLTGLEALEAVRLAVDRVEVELGQSVRVSTSRLASQAASAADRISSLESELRSAELDMHYAEASVSQMEQDQKNGGAGPTMLDSQRVGVLQTKVQNLQQEISNARSRAGSCQIRVDDFTVYASEVVTQSETVCGKARDFLRRLAEHINQYGHHHG